MRRILIKPDYQNRMTGGQKGTGSEGKTTGSAGSRMEKVLPPEETWDLIITTAAELEMEIENGGMRHSRILMAVQLDDTGINLESVRMLSLLRRNHGYEMPGADHIPEAETPSKMGDLPKAEAMAGCMEESAGAILVDGSSELFTKAFCRDLAFAMNGCGCLLPGKPAVEATGSLKNFMVRARNSGHTWEEEYAVCVQEMLERLWNIEIPKNSVGLSARAAKLPEPRECLPSEYTGFTEDPHHKKVLCLHASEYRTSNTLKLWTMVRKTLQPYVEIEEISLRNGEIKDCGGCPYHMCMHFSDRSSCYYGGPIPEKVYPALEACDALLILCPNYNDAVSANISAFINRLTALFRRRPFYEKYLYAIVVSGYSGSDIVAGQLLDSLTLNKTFRLPPYFSMMETANDPGSIVQVEHIEARAQSFAERILAVLYG